MAAAHELLQTAAGLLPDLVQLALIRPLALGKAIPGDQREDVLNVGAGLPAPFRDLRKLPIIDARDKYAVDLYHKSGGNCHPDAFPLAGKKQLRAGFTGKTHNMLVDLRACLGGGRVDRNGQRLHAQLADESHRLRQEQAIGGQTDMDLWEGLPDQGDGLVGLQVVQRLARTGDCAFLTCPARRGDTC